LPYKTLTVSTSRNLPASATEGQIGREKELKRRSLQTLLLVINNYGLCATSGQQDAASSILGINVKTVVYIHVNGQ